MMDKRTGGHKILKEKKKQISVNTWKRNRLAYVS